MFVDVISQNKHWEAEYIKLYKPYGPDIEESVEITKVTELIQSMGWLTFKEALVQFCNNNSAILMHKCRVKEAEKWGNLGIRISNLPKFLPND